MDKYVKCAVRTCSNNSKKSGNRIRYFRFPREDDLLTLWTVRCDRLDTWTPSTSFVCSSHFTADDYLEVTPGISRLHPEAVPSRNLGYDWDNDDRADVMMMEEDFTSDDEENNDSIARALMSMSEKATSKITPTTPMINFPLTGGTFVPNYPSTSTESVPNQARLDKANDPNLIVITDITKKYKPLKQVPLQTPVKKTKRQKNLFCCVPTCSAFKGKDEDVRNGFHYFPREVAERKKWIQAIFHNELFIKNSRFICRRHFTTDDYREKPRPGVLPRLRKGAVPSQNIPICESEFLLARKKLWLDAFRRKPEDKNLTFVQQLSREPELQELLKRFVQDALRIDPKRAHVVPCIPRRGDFRGCGVPVQGTGIIPEKKKKSKKTFDELTEEEKAEYLAKKAKKEQVKNERKRLRELRKKVRRKQLSEERKMRLFEEKLERLELRRSNPQAYHELLAEERLMQRQEELTKRIASGTFKFPPNKSENLTMTSVELKSLKESDPEAYSRLLSDTLVMQRKERLAKKITDAAIIKNPVNFSDKIEIIANDPEKGGKYKIVVKKVFQRKRDMNKDYIAQLSKNKEKSMEIVHNVIKEIDFTKAKRIKFAETEKLTKISKLRSMGIDVQGLGMIKNQPDKEAAPSSSEQPVVVEPMITGEDIVPTDDDVPQDVVQDHQSDEDHFDDHFGGDHHSDNDIFGDISCTDNFFDDMTDGFDHSYTNKTTQPDEESRPKDPFDELKNQLEVLPEDLARALVREKMDGYKETFKKQMTRMRALLQSKKKIDRKVKMLTRALCLSLREQYVKYYKN